MKLISVDDWIYFYPQKGDKNRFLPNFSEEDDEECIGFEIRYDGREKVKMIPNPGIVQAPYDFHGTTKKIHTSPCLHLAECDPETRDKYALMQFCIRYPKLLVKDGLGM